MLKVLSSLILLAVILGTEYCALRACLGYAETAHLTAHRAALLIMAAVFAVQLSWNIVTRAAKDA